MSKKLYFGDNFNDLNMNDYFFIDKTRMISKLIGNDKSVYLITRPRRFGKNLNLKMVNDFFEKPYIDNNNKREEFDGLEISKNRKNMREFHKYSVIFLNFKKDASKNYKSILNFLKSEISKLFKYHKKILILMN